MNDEKKLTTRDWHRADIIAAVRKTQTNLQALSRRHGLSRTTLSNALYSPCPRYERLIAEQIGVTPQTIWPSRYHLDGSPKSGKGERKSDACDHYMSNVSIASDSRNPYPTQPQQLFVAGALNDEKYCLHVSDPAYDMITGLPGKPLFLEHLTQFVHYAKQSSVRKVAVLVVKVGRFEHAAEILGDKAAAALLNDIALRLNERMPVAHLRRDEFAVLHTSHDVPDAGVFRAVEEIKSVFSSPFKTDGGEVLLSCNIGASVYPWHGDESQELLAHATSALLSCRNLSCHGVHIYSEQAIGSEREHLFLEAALHRALERNELSLHFQPQMDVQANSIIGAETLLRWNQSERGMISPERFIPIAEESGLILPIGIWTLRQVCKRLRVWDMQGMRLERIAINISAKQFSEPRFAGMVESILREFNVDPDRLELEVTESLLLEDLDVVVGIMTQLRKLGVHISLDDFGVGYANLCYISCLPVDSIKIDKSFIRNIASDPASMAIAEGILAIAKRLGLRVIAEGVETQEQLDILTNSGCHLVQGYYFHKPMPDHVFSKVLGQACITRCHIPLRAN